MAQILVLRQTVCTTYTPHLLFLFHLLYNNPLSIYILKINFLSIYIIYIYIHNIYIYIYNLHRHGIVKIKSCQGPLMYTPIGWMIVRRLMQSMTNEENRDM